MVQSCRCTVLFGVEVVWEYQLLMERTQFTGSVVSIANRYHLRDILFEDGRVIE